MSNSEYWARRFKELEDTICDHTYEFVENLEKQFDYAIRDVETKMRAWYQRFADNNKISLAEAKRLLKSDELKEFKWTVQEYIEKGKEMELNGAWIKELENASARVHISRLDTLKLQLRQYAEMLTKKQIEAVTDAAEYSYTESYYHTAFEFQKGIGIGWTMQGVNKNLLTKVLSQPWTVDGMSFTARCWTNKDKLVEVLNRELTRMVATGAAPDRAIETIAKQFNTSKRNAGRVVMTESAAFSSAARKDCFNELDVEMFEFVAALDHHTCDLCGEMDGKVFKMSEYQVGVTAEPLHPCCRCTTAPYFEDMAGLGERYARDIGTGKTYKVPSDMTYQQWKAKQDEKYGAGSVDLARKKEYNKSADKVQYQRYKEALGKDAPATFEEFQNTKYSDSDNWNTLKQQYRSTNTKVVTEKPAKSGNINKSVEIPADCQHLLRAETNFENKDISTSILKSIDDTIDKRYSEKSDFVFDEIKIAKFAKNDKSIFITNLEAKGSIKKTQLYLNGDYFLGKSKQKIDAECIAYYGSNWWKSKSLEDLVNHEIMHARINYYNSYEKVERLYQTLSEDSRVKGFCGLVDKYPSEFLNEMYVALNRNENINSKYIDVFNEYAKEFLGG